ncbi:MAG: DUF4388 domain-containing protein [Myxococcota bacterium]
MGKAEKLKDFAVALRLRPVPLLQGETSVLSMPDLILWLANREQTGVLVVEHAFIKKELWIEGGRVIRAASNSPREYLGQFLINFGLLTEEQLQRARQTQEETQVMLGRILVMIGTCAEEHVVRTLEHKIMETVLDAIRFNPARFTFESRPVARERPEIEVAVPLIEIHRRGAERAPHWAQIAAAFPTPQVGFRVNEAAIPPLEPLDPIDKRLLMLAKAAMNLEAIFTEMMVVEFELYSRIMRLLHHRALELAPPGAPATNIPMTADLEAFDRELAQALDGNAAAGPEQIEQAIPALTAPLDDILRHRPSPKDRYILTRIDGTRPVAALLPLVPMADNEAIEVLRSLARDGFIRFG